MNPLFRMHPDGTASRGSRIFGVLLAVAVAVFLAVALVISPPDSGANASENSMGELVRIMYVHVPVAVACYLAFFVTAVASVMYLIRKTEGWDLLAASSAEVGVVFTLLTLATGSVWGHIAWGTWWEWDPRLTSTLLMLIVYVGYLALRSAVLDPVVRAKRAAVVGLVAFANVPIVHYSVDCHHQPARPHHRRAQAVRPHVRDAGGGGRLRVADDPPVQTGIRPGSPGGEGARLGPGRTPGRGRRRNPHHPQGSAVMIPSILAATADEIGYVYGSYALAVGSLAGYAVYTIRRGRAVGRQVPPEDRRWM